MRTYLVAVVADTEQQVLDFLADSSLGPGKPYTTDDVEAYWLAEDDRTGDHQGHSAVLVPRGAQDDIDNLIKNWMDSNEDAWTEEGYPYATTDRTNDFWTHDIDGDAAHA